VIFVDTSAFFAILDRDDDAHAVARQAWTALLSAEAPASLVTSSYVLVESFALIQARLGLDAVRALHDAILPVVAVPWVLEQDHAAAVSALLAADRRRLSLVDCCTSRSCGGSVSGRRSHMTSTSPSTASRSSAARGSSSVGVILALGSNFSGTTSQPACQPDDA
jgi:predicted nucleic acid-binding protein